MKFEEKGYFKSKEKAYDYAAKLKQKGKRTRVVKRIDPRDGTIYLVQVWSAKPFWGKDFKIDMSR